MSAYSIPKTLCLEDTTLTIFLATPRLTDDIVSKVVVDSSFDNKKIDVSHEVARFVEDLTESKNGEHIVDRRPEYWSDQDATWELFKPETQQWMVFRPRERGGSLIRLGHTNEGFHLDRDGLICKELCKNELCVNDSMKMDWNRAPAESIPSTIKVTKGFLLGRSTDEPWISVPFDPDKETNLKKLVANTLLWYDPRKGRKYSQVMYYDTKKQSWEQFTNKTTDRDVFGPVKNGGCRLLMPFFIKCKSFSAPGKMRKPSPLAMSQDSSVDEPSAHIYHTADEPEDEYGVLSDSEQYKLYRKMEKMELEKLKAERSNRSSTKVRRAPVNPGNSTGAIRLPD